ncbi:MAG: hypothetical protein ACRC4N_08040 [Gammaproteobacteria bacterium]
MWAWSIQVLYKFYIIAELFLPVLLILRGVCVCVCVLGGGGGYLLKH